MFALKPEIASLLFFSSQHRRFTLQRWIALCRVSTAFEKGFPLVVNLI